MSATKIKPTANNQPDWKRTLKMDYQTLIIENCSKMTRDAVAANEVIKVHLDISFKTVIISMMSGPAKEKISEERDCQYGCWSSCACVWRSWLSK